MGKYRGERRKLDGTLGQPTTKADWRVLCSCVVNTVVSEWETALKYLCLKRKYPGATSVVDVPWKWPCVKWSSVANMILQVNYETSPRLAAIREWARHQSGRESFAPGLSLSGETVNSAVPSHTSLMMYGMIIHATAVEQLPPCCKWRLYQLHNIQTWFNFIICII